MTNKGKHERKHCMNKYGECHSQTTDLFQHHPQLLIESLAAQHTLTYSVTVQMDLPLSSEESGQC